MLRTTHLSFPTIGDTVYLPFCISDLLQDLKDDVQFSIKSAFAIGTRKNLKVHWRAFLLFCNFFNLNAVLPDLDTICLFIHFLSCSFKSVSSIKNYISQCSS